MKTPKRRSRKTPKPKTDRADPNVIAHSLVQKIIAKTEGEPRRVPVRRK